MTTVDDETEEFKIWFPYEVFYIESMLTITRTAMAEQSIFRTKLEECSEGEEIDSKIMIDLLQNIISHAAAISRYFWPSNNAKIHKNRGQKLRESFEINESNPLRSRDVRNFIEHFDEKLDNYLSEGISGNIFPIYVGPVVNNDDAINHFFRAYYTDEWTFEVLGLKYKIQPIINELIRIHLLLEEFSSNGGRFPKKKPMLNK